MRKNLLVAALGLLAAGSLNAQTAYTPSVLTQDGGTFYVYNPATGLWLQNNDTYQHAWSTALNVGDVGMPFIFYNPAQSTSYPDYFSWWINPQFGSQTTIDGNANNDTGFLYLDIANANQTWDVSGAGDDYGDYPNGYFIEGGVGGYIFGVRTDTVPNRISLSEDNATTVWQLITRKDRIAADSANATPEKPVDVSYLLGNPRLANNYRADGWQSDQRDFNLGTGVGPNTQQLGDNAFGGDFQTGSQTSREYWSTKAFDFYQVLTGIPNGTYEFSVRGFYRDGSTEARNYQQSFVAQNRKDGTENIRAEYYAGATSHPMMSIIDGAKPELTGAYNVQLMLDADNASEYGYVPNNLNDVNYTLWSGGYQNPTIKVIVTDNTLRVGVRKSDGVNDDWTVFSDFSLKYDGAQISGDVTELINALQATVDQANAYTGSIPPALAEEYQAAKDAADNALKSTDAATINNANNTLTNELTKLKAVSDPYSNLLAAINIAKSVDNGDDADLTATIASAENVAQNGTTADEFNAPQNELKNAAKNAAANKTEDVFDGETPTDGTFYIYNVGAKRFLQGGSDWGTHAAVGQPGLEFTLATEGDGFTINREGGAEGRYLGYNGYTDVGDHSLWKFVPVAGKEGVYNIERVNPEEDGTQNILGFAPGSRTDAENDGLDSRVYFATVSTVATDVNDPKNQWKLVSYNQREELLEDATVDKPADATFKLQHPGFDKFDNASGWTDNSVDGGHSVNRGTDRLQDFVFEGWNTTSFDLNQTVTGLPAGYYQIKFNGYYRDGAKETEQEKVANGEAQQQLAYLYLENVEDYRLPLVPITDGLNKLPGIGWEGPQGWQPDDVTAAAEYFEYGLYKNVSAPFELKDGDNLTFGIAKDDVNENDWIVVDNFQLLYFGTQQPTGIKGITTTDAAAEANNANAPIYNVAGQRVDKNYKGIVIQNGKKRIVK